MSQLPNDTAQIRELIADWLRATAAGDLDRLLGLMAEDVVYLLPGQPPMRGRESFAAAFRTALQSFRIEGRSQIQEIQVAGHMAYCWNHLTVTLRPLAGGSPARRSGNVLTVLRKNLNGRWQVFRDANLLTADAPAGR
jgi:uncharacterized protein (TIGR02246 family)